MKQASVKPATIDTYIAEHPPDVRKILERIRRTIRKAAPEALERISYQMPAFQQRGVGILAYFGAFKGHIGFYPPVRDPALAREAAVYAGPKGNLRFPLDEPIPYGLIEKVVTSRLLGSSR